MKPADVKSNTYINSNHETNDKDLKFKIGDIVRISKYENIFGKCYFPNWFEEDFVVKMVKNILPWAYIINNLNGKEIVEMFYVKKNSKNKLKRVQ